MSSPASVPSPGVYVPTVTFFKPSASVVSSPRQAPLDIQTQTDHSVHLAKNGVRGLVPLGSTGEAVHLSRGERFDLLSEVRKGLTAAGFIDYPIIAGVLTNSVDEALEWLDDSRKAGAQWGLVLAPGYFGGVVDQENLIAWYTLVADASPIPILLGFGQQLGPIVMFGAAGVIDGLAAMYPATVARLFDLVFKSPLQPEDMFEIQSLQFIVSRAEEIVGKWGIVGIKEGIFQVLKFGNMEGGRLPLKGRMPEREWKAWSFAMDAMKETEAVLEK